MPVGGAWEAHFAETGPWNLDESGSGYANYEIHGTAAHALYFSFFRGAKLEEVGAMASTHRLPAWLNVPPWDPGARSVMTVSDHPGLRIQRTNGFRHEELQIIQMQRGVLALHLLDFLSGPYSDFTQASEAIVSAAERLPVEALGRISRKPAWPSPWVVPQTLPACFKALDRWFTKEQRNRFKKDKESDLFLYGEGVGGRQRPNALGWIEPAFGLRDGGSPLSRALKAAGFDEHAYAEAILNAYHHEVLGDKIDLTLILESLSNQELAMKTRSKVTPVD